MSSAPAPAPEPEPAIEPDPPVEPNDICLRSCDGDCDDDDDGCGCCCGAESCEALERGCDAGSTEVGVPEPSLAFCGPRNFSSTRDVVLELFLADADAVAAFAAATAAPPLLAERCWSPGFDTSSNDEDSSSSSSSSSSSLSLPAYLAAIWAIEFFASLADAGGEVDDPAGVGFVLEPLSDLCSADVPAAVAAVTAVVAAATVATVAAAAVPAMEEDRGL